MINVPGRYPIKRNRLQARAAACRVLLSILLILAVVNTGHAELFGDVFKPFAAVSENYDSNVFRVNDREQLKAQTGGTQLGDFCTTVTAGTAVRYQISGQSIDMILKRDMILYSHYSDQNTNRDQTSSTLNLSAFNNLKLTLNGKYSLAPESRVDYRSADVSRRQDLVAEGVASYETISGIDIAVTYRRTMVDFLLPQYRANEYAIDLFAGTLSYRLSPDTTISGSVQREYRDYPFALQMGIVSVNNSSVSDSINVGLSRSTGAKTTISGYVGFLERRHDQASGRNFDGMVGRADINYAVTSLLTLTVNTERQLYEETFADRHYSVNDALGTGLIYQISSKIKATVTERTIRKSFKDVPNAGVASRRDWLQDWKADIEWKPLNKLTVSAGYQYSNRTSSESNSYNFSDHSIQTGVRYSY